jgi:hypothetical protein
MLSRGQMIFINSGQSTKLLCEFTADEFNLFDNPVVWKKVQRDEESQINVMSNIIEPFLKINKMAVSMFTDSLTYRLTLALHG